MANDPRRVEGRELRLGQDPEYAFLRHLARVVHSDGLGNDVPETEGA